MYRSWSRRSAIRNVGMGALALPDVLAFEQIGSVVNNEGPQTPKLCLEAGAGSLAAGTLDEAGFRRINQLGVNYVAMGGPRIPWQENSSKASWKRCKLAALCSAT